MTVAAEPASAPGLFAFLVSSTLAASLLSAFFAFQTQRSTTRLAHKLDKNLGIYTKRSSSYEALWETLASLRRDAKQGLTPEGVGVALESISMVRSKHGLYLSPEVVGLLQDVTTLLEGVPPDVAVSTEAGHLVYGAVLLAQDRLQFELESERPVH